MENVVLFKIVEEDGEMVMLYDKKEFEKLGLSPGDYMIMGKVGENGFLLSKVEIPTE